MNHETNTICPECGHEYDASQHWLVCPNCGYETNFEEIVINQVF